MLIRIKTHNIPEDSLARRFEEVVERKIVNLSRGFTGRAARIIGG
jgi:hypothetical protein